MSDKTTQALGRDDENTGAQVKALRARTRDGSLSEAKLQLAAYLGHPAARELLGDAAPPVPEDPEAWVAGLKAFDGHLLAFPRVGLCAARLVRPTWDAQRPDDPQVARYLEAMTRRILGPSAKGDRLSPRPFKHPLPDLEQPLRVVGRALSLIELYVGPTTISIPLDVLWVTLLETTAGLVGTSELRHAIAREVGAWALGDDPLPNQLVELEAAELVDPVTEVAFASTSASASATERAMHAALEELRPSSPAELDDLRARFVERLEAGGFGAPALLDVEYCPTPCIPQRLVESHNLDLTALLAKENPQLQEPEEEIGTRQQDVYAQLAKGPHGYAAAVFLSRRLNEDTVRALAGRMLNPLEAEHPKLLAQLRAELEEAKPSAEVSPEDKLLMAIFGKQKTLGQTLVDVLNRAADGGLTWAYLNELIAWELLGLGGRP